MRVGFPVGDITTEAWLSVLLDEIS